MLDKLPPIVRHFLLMAIAVGIAIGIPHLKFIHLNKGMIEALAPVFGIALTYLTKLTNQYGVGKTPDPLHVVLGGLTDAVNGLAAGNPTIDTQALAGHLADALKSVLAVPPMVVVNSTAADPALVIVPAADGLPSVTP